MSLRSIRRLIPAMETSDGAGVRLRRSLGQSEGARLDPFLMLDEFFSEDPEDYIAGFPAHPHRGFETVTYLVDGHLLHEDHLGNRGHLRDGGAQWMTAGRGVIHSEMPQQTCGRLRGFQLWINLPAAEKMQPAHYQDVGAEQFPRMRLRGGGEAILIAGRLAIDGAEGTGYFNGLDQRQLSTDPIYNDLHLGEWEEVDLDLPARHNAFLYVYEGKLQVGDRRVGSGIAALLGPGERVRAKATDGPAKCLLLAARPIGEPVVQYGPFVMNTPEEIEQALRDYRDGVLVQP